MSKRKRERGPDTAADGSLLPKVQPHEDGSSSSEFEETVIEIEKEEVRIEKPDVRAYERTATDYPVVVQYKEDHNEAWKEHTVLNTLSRNGAALTLSRSIPIGRLVSMVMQVPAAERLYDKDEPVYPMLGIVQHSFRVPSGDGEAYSVGLAFIGKAYPESFKTNPSQCYRLTGMDEDGLWLVTEAASQFQARKHSRFWRRFKVSVSVRDEVNRISRKEEVITRDISAGGMSFFGKIAATTGDRIKVVIPETDFYTIATIRNVSKPIADDSDLNVYHLEFEHAELPIELILRSTRRAGEASTSETPTENASRSDERTTPGSGDPEVTKF